jgi:hypothetical protein
MCPTLRRRLAAVCAVSLATGVTAVLAAGPARAAGPLSFDVFTSPNTGGFTLDSQVGLINADAFPDVVSGRLNGPQGGFVVTLGNGDGTFRAPLLVPTADAHYSPGLGDVDKDGLDDVVMNDAAGHAQVLFSNGDGTFTDGPVTTIGPSIAIPDLVDLDKDGVLDLVVASHAGDGMLTVYAGTTAGSFTLAGSFPEASDTQNYRPKTADLNRDGYPDIVSSNWTTTGIVLLSQGAGTFDFGAPQPFSSAGNIGVGIGDVNGDDHPDITLGTEDGFATLVFDPVTGVLDRTDLTTGSAGVATAVGDFDQDGIADVAVAVDGAVVVHVGLGAGAFDLGGTVFPAASYAYGLTAADLNLDGQPDVVVPDASGRDVVLTNTSVVVADPVITVQPAGNEVGEGDDADGLNTVELSSTATSSGALSARWQVSKDDAPFVDLVEGPAVVGATASGTDEASSTLVITRPQADYDDRYRIVWTGAGGSTTSAVTAWQVYYATLVTEPADVTVDEGEPASFSVTVNPDGADAQWFVSTDDGATFEPVDGATSYTYAIPATTAAQSGNLYQVVVNVYGQADTSRPALLVVDAAPVVTGPGDQSVADGATATFSATSDDPTATLSWERSVAGAAFTAVGDTEGDYSFDAVLADDGDRVRAVFTNGVGSTTSRVALLTVNANAPVITNQPDDTTIASGGSATFAAGASSNPAATVQWQLSAGGGLFVDVPGADATTLTVSGVEFADSGHEYRAVFTNPAGPATTSAAILTVTAAAPTVTTNPSSRSVLVGDAVTFSAAASGDPLPSVQWQVSLDGAPFTSVVGGTDVDLTFTAVRADTGNRYRAVFTNAGDTDTTTAATLTVSTAPLVTEQPGNVTVQQGATASFTAAASGAPAPSVQWQVSTNGTSFADLAGATSDTYAVTTAMSMDGNRYRAVFTSTGGGVITTAATLTVTGSPVVTATAPGVVGSVMATQTGPGEVTITWEAPSATAGSSPVDGYHVGYGNGYGYGNGGSGQSVGATTFSQVFNGLGAGAYQASVTATSAAGNGTPTRVAFTITAAPVVAPVLPPAAPVVPTPDVTGGGSGNGDEVLPATGAEPGLVGLMGASLLATGAAVLAAGRRRRCGG